MTTEQIAKKWENLKARYKVGITAKCVFLNAKNIQQFHKFTNSSQGCEISSHRRGEESHLLEMVQSHGRRSG